MHKGKIAERGLFFEKLIASREIVLVLWNSKVYYRTHNSPPVDDILSLVDPFYFHLILNRRKQKTRNERRSELMWRSLVCDTFEIMMSDVCATAMLVYFLF